MTLPSVRIVFKQSSKSDVLLPLISLKQSDQKVISVRVLLVLVVVFFLFFLSA